MWTYSGDPDSSPKDHVRFLVGDTDQSDPLLNDKEIEYFLSKYNNGALITAIRCCETIAAKFSRRVNETVGKVSMDFSQAAKAYRDMAADLRRRLSIEDMKPYVGGISVADKQANASNSNRVPPDFSKHMMEDTLVAPITNPEPNEFSLANQTEENA